MLQTLSAFLLSFCLLTGCVSNSAPTPLPTEEPFPEDLTSIGDLIPGVEDAQSVSVEAGTTSYQFGTFAYAAANEQEQETLLSLLLAADLSEFFLPDESYDMGGAAVSLRIETDAGVYDVKVMADVSDQNIQYLFFSNGSENCIYQGNAAFDFIPLSQAAHDVLYNMDDPDHSGRAARADGTGEALPITKMYTALAQQILDGTLALADAPQSDPGAAYDVVFTVGDTTYQLNSQTGQFARLQGEEQLYATVDSKWQLYIQTYLGYSALTDS